MLKLIEINLGNWFRNKKENSSFQWTIGHWISLYNGELILSDIEPIMLNLDWLDLFQFKYNMTKTAMWKTPNDNFVIGIENNEGNLSYYLSYFMIKEDEPVLVNFFEIIYVHELQNLFLVHEKEELKILI